MRFIHTADWHLGKLFYGQYLTEEQAWVLRERFLPLVDEVKPDVILLAGDVYDRSVPPAEAVDLFDEMVSEIVGRRHIPFVVISGNHDSSGRLSFGSRLLAEEGLYMCGDIMRTVRPVILRDAEGEVAFAPMPYAETAEVRRALSDESVHTHEEAVRALSEHLLGQIPAGMRRIAVAHDFIAGGTASDSERPLSIGGTEVVPAEIFAPYDYTALGHLHGPQKAGGSERIRYSGSLMKYSFGEADQRKGVVVGEIGGLGMVTTSFRELVPRRDVRVIRGTFRELMERDDEAPEDFLMADLMDEGPVIDAMARLRQKYPHVMALRTHLAVQEDSGSRRGVRERVDMMDMLDIFSQEFQGRSLTEEERAFLESVRREGKEAQR